MSYSSFKGEEITDNEQEAHENSRNTIGKIKCTKFRDEEIIPNTYIDCNLTRSSSRVSSERNEHSIIASISDLRFRHPDINSLTDDGISNIKDNDKRYSDPQRLTKNYISLSSSNYSPTHDRTDENTYYNTICNTQLYPHNTDNISTSIKNHNIHNTSTISTPNLQNTISNTQLYPYDNTKAINTHNTLSNSQSYCNKTTTSNLYNSNLNDQGLNDSNLNNHSFNLHTYNTVNTHLPITHQFPSHNLPSSLSHQTPSYIPQPQSLSQQTPSYISQPHIPLHQTSYISQPQSHPLSHQTNNSHIPQSHPVSHQTLSQPLSLQTLSHPRPISHQALSHIPQFTSSSMSHSQSHYNSHTSELASSSMLHSQSPHNSHTPQSQHNYHTPQLVPSSTLPNLTIHPECSSLPQTNLCVDLNNPPFTTPLDTPLSTLSQSDFKISIPPSPPPSCASYSSYQSTCSMDPAQSRASYASFADYNPHVAVFGKNEEWETHSFLGRIPNQEAKKKKILKQKKMLLVTLLRALVKYGATTHRTEFLILKAAEGLDIKCSALVFPNYFTLTFSDKGRLADPSECSSIALSLVNGLDCYKLQEVEALVVAVAKLKYKEEPYISKYQYDHNNQVNTSNDNYQTNPSFNPLTQNTLFPNVREKVDINENYYVHSNTSENEGKREIYRESDVNKEKEVKSDANKEKEIKDENNHLLNLVSRNYLEDTNRHSKDENMSNNDNWGNKTKSGKNNYKHSKQNNTCKYSENTTCKHESVTQYALYQTHTSDLEYQDYQDNGTHCDIEIDSDLHSQSHSDSHLQLYSNHYKGNDCDNHSTSHSQNPSDTYETHSHSHSHSHSHTHSDSHFKMDLDVDFIQSKTLFQNEVDSSHEIHQTHSNSDNHISFDLECEIKSNTPTEAGNHSQFQDSQKLDISGNPMPLPPPPLPPPPGVYSQSECIQTDFEDGEEGNKKNTSLEQNTDVLRQNKTQSTETEIIMNSEDQSKLKEVEVEYQQQDDLLVNKYNPSPEVYNSEVYSPEGAEEDYVEGLGGFATMRRISVDEDCRYRSASIETKNSFHDHQVNEQNEKIVETQNLKYFLNDGKDQDKDINDTTLFHPTLETHNEYSENKEITMNKGIIVRTQLNPVEESKNESEEGKDQRKKGERRERVGDENGYPLEHLENKENHSNQNNSNDNQNNSNKINTNLIKEDFKQLKQQPSKEKQKADIGTITSESKETIHQTGTLSVLQTHFPNMPNVPHSVSGETNQNIHSEINPNIHNDINQVPQTNMYQSLYNTYNSYQLDTTHSMPSVYDAFPSLLPSNTYLPCNTLLPSNVLPPSNTCLSSNTCLPSNVLPPSNTCLSSNTCLPSNSLLPCNTLLSHNTCLLSNTYNALLPCNTSTPTNEYNSSSTINYHPLSATQTKDNEIVNNYITEDEKESTLPTLQIQTTLNTNNPHHTVYPGLETHGTLSQLNPYNTLTPQFNGNNKITSEYDTNNTLTLDNNTYHPIIIPSRFKADKTKLSELNINNISTNTIPSDLTVFNTISHAPTAHTHNSTLSLHTLNTLNYPHSLHPYLLHPQTIHPNLLHHPSLHPNLHPHTLHPTRTHNNTLNPEATFEDYNEGLSNSIWAPSLAPATNLPFHSNVYDCPHQSISNVQINPYNSHSYHHHQGNHEKNKPTTSINPPVRRQIIKPEIKSCWELFSTLKLADYSHLSRDDPLKIRITLHQIMIQPTLYPVWLQSLMMVVLSTSTVALSYQGGPSDLWATFFLSFIVASINFISVYIPLLIPLQSALSCILVSFFAFMIKHYWLTDICLLPVSLGAVLFLLPGYSITAGVLELTSRSLISGTVRFTNAIFSTLQMGFGLAIGGRLMNWAHIDSSTPCLPPISPLWALLSFPIMSLSMSILLGGHPKQWIGMAIAGAISVFGNIYLTGVIASDLITVVMAFTVGLFCNILGYFLNEQPIPYTLSGIIFLVPGGLSVKGAVFIFNKDSSHMIGFINIILNTLLSIAIGLLLARFTFPYSNMKKQEREEKRYRRNEQRKKDSQKTKEKEMVDLRQGHTNQLERHSISKSSYSSEGKTGGRTSISLNHTGSSPYTSLHHQNNTNSTRGIGQYNKRNNRLQFNSNSNSLSLSSSHTESNSTSENYEYTDQIEMLDKTSKKKPNKNKIPKSKSDEKEREKEATTTISDQIMARKLSTEDRHSQSSGNTKEDKSLALQALINVEILENHFKSVSPKKQHSERLEKTQLKSSPNTSQNNEELKKNYMEMHTDNLSEDNNESMSKIALPLPPLPPPFSYNISSSNLNPQESDRYSDNRYNDKGTLHNNPNLNHEMYRMSKDNSSSLENNVNTDTDTNTNYQVHIPRTDIVTGTINYHHKPTKLHFNPNVSLIEQNTDYIPPHLPQTSQTKYHTNHKGNSHLYPSQKHRGDTPLTHQLPVSLDYYNEGRENLPYPQSSLGRDNRKKYKYPLSTTNSMNNLNNYERSLSQMSMYNGRYSNDSDSMDTDISLEEYEYKIEEESLL